MNRNFPRFSFAPMLALVMCSGIFSSHPAGAQPHSTNKMQTENAMGQGPGENSNQGAKANDLANGIGGNVPDVSAEQNSYGVTSPGRLIGPSPENGQPDPRFPNERGTSGGGNEINGLSTAAGSAQAPNGSDNSAPGNESGATTSNLNEGLPSASKDNSGGNSGGDARSGARASQNMADEGDVGSQTRGAAPYALILGVIVIGTFLAVMMGARAKKNR